MVCLVVESAELKRHTFYTGAVLLTGVMAWGCLFLNNAMQFLLISDCTTYSENWIFNLIFTGYCKKIQFYLLMDGTQSVCGGD